MGSCRWGAFASPRSGQDGQTAVRALETLIGRKLAITRHYLEWNAALPGSFIDWSATHGRVPYVSWHTRPLTWKTVASGRQDVWIKKQAESIKAAGYPMYFCFHHEPENEPSLGGAADFAAAANHVRDVFDRVGVANLTWVITLMASTYAGGSGGPEPWLPNHTNYDLLGVDGYNRFPCLLKRDRHPWRSFAELFGPARSFALAKDKRLFVGEYGCVEQNACGYPSGHPRAKKRWFLDAGSTLESWPEVKAVVYSHTQAYHQGFAEAFWVDTSKYSLDAFKTVGGDPYFA